MLWISSIVGKCFQNVYIYSCLVEFFYHITLLNQHGYSQRKDPSYMLNPKPHKKQFDFIIVGAGTSGSVVASRLSENQNINVLLLEAGDVPSWLTDVPGITGYWPDSVYDYSYKLQTDSSICHNNPSSCVMSRGKVLGGTSTINDMTYVRGNEVDFDNWAKQGNPGWSWGHVLPFFKYSERLMGKIPHADYMVHNTGGNLGVDILNKDNARPFFDAARKNGYKITDYNSGQQVGVSWFQYTRENGKRVSSNTAFIKPFRQTQQNLSIRTNSKVINVIIDSYTRKATGVEYVPNDGKRERAFVSKEVILCAGAIETPKILMLSGIGPKEELNKANVKHYSYLAVGRNLQDHVSTSYITLTVKDTAGSLKSLSNEVSFFRTGAYPSMREISRPSLFGVTNFVSTGFETREGVPDIQITYLKSLQSNKYHYNAISHYNKLIVQTTLLAPKSRGRVTLNNDDPRNGEPLIYPNYLEHPDDVEVLVEGLKITTKLMSSSDIKLGGITASVTPAPKCSHYLRNKENYYRCITKNYYTPLSHPAGTCKMGPPSDREAVVDSRLRVYNIKNLRVIDASIMPTITRGSTYASTIMIGEKGSYMIRQDWNLF